MTSSEIRDRLFRVVGSEADITALGGNRVAVAPKSESACAAVLRTATSLGWSVRVAACADDATSAIPADLVLTTERLDTISDIQPADLFATAGAGVRIAAMNARFAEYDTWLAVDPPGTDRCIGAAAATGASGPLQTGYGPIRDQILGMTIITPAGRTIVAGGRVVKNVAGYDIPKLVVGSYGAFGIITQLHLRLRVMPNKDVTLIARGAYGELLELKQQVEFSTVTAAALELRCEQSTDWTLAVRLVGSDGMVDRSSSRLPKLNTTNWEVLPPDTAMAFWALGRTASCGGRMTVRLGPNQTTLEWTLNELHKNFVGGHTTVTGVRNVVRWSGNTDKENLANLRTAAADNSVPMTIEHAPWDVLESLGHFGDLKQGVAPLMSALRSAFDPNGTLVVPLESRQLEHAL